MNIVTELQRLDLRTFPVNEIYSILDQIGPIALMTTDYNSPKCIERAVRNAGDEVFSTVSRISYNPTENNNSYQRASTPDNTMFYGFVVPEKVSYKEIDRARITGVFEVAEVLRDKNIVHGENRLTFGKWHIKDQISLTTIFDPTLDYEIDYLNEVKENYLKTIKSAPPEIQEKSIRYLKYLASEFSKEVAKGENHEYLISAIFTDILIKNGRDGVIYPSVQAGGMGLCVAIHPSAVKKMELIAVLQGNIIKEEYSVYIKNEKSCAVEEGAIDFKLMDSEY
jgi:hypothetical protein